MTIYSLAGKLGTKKISIQFSLHHATAFWKTRIHLNSAFEIIVSGKREGIGLLTTESFKKRFVTDPNCEKKSERAEIT